MKITVSISVNSFAWLRISLCYSLRTFLAHRHAATLDFAAANRRAIREHIAALRELANREVTP